MKRHNNMIAFLSLIILQISFNYLSQNILMADEPNDCIYKIYSTGLDSLFDIMVSDKYYICQVYNGMLTESLHKSITNDIKQFDKTLAKNFFKYSGKINIVNDSFIVHSNYSFVDSTTMKAYTRNPEEGNIFLKDSVAGFIFSLSRIAFNKKRTEAAFNVLIHNGAGGFMVYLIVVTKKETGWTIEYIQKSARGKANSPF